MPNNLFTYPYTKISVYQNIKYMCQGMAIDRRPTSDYLDRIVSLGLLQKNKQDDIEKLF